MRIVAILLILSCGAVQAQPANVSAAITALHAVVKPAVDWNAAGAQKADVTCDGKPDVILLGTRQKSAWVAVVRSNGKPLAMEFPISASVENGFCHAPRKISIRPITCDTPALGHLDGCTPIKACMEFQVEDDGCKPFHFYWDSRIKGIRTWRDQ